jgi:hypothetical protein
MKLPILVQAHKESGAIVTMKTITNKSTGEEREVGTVMVRQNAISGLSGIGRVSKRVAFITLESEVVELLTPMLSANQPFPVEGKIVIEETLVPYVKSDGTTQTPKTNPNTGEVITYQGSPVYRNSFFTEVMSTQDVFLRDSASDEETAPE